MPASIKRKQSKRMTCRKKYKIIKKVAEHRRKVRREQRKNPKHNKPKDPGVPNSLPFKEEILQEAEQRKQRAQALKESQKANRLKLQLQNRGIDEMISIASEMDKEQSLKKEDISPKEKEIDLGTASRDLKKLIEEADVVLEVLDARDPMGCRCPQLEELVLKYGKKLILVLNKIDLVPRCNLEEWLHFLRQSVPTFAFKASTPTPLTKPFVKKKSKGKFNQNIIHNLNFLSQCVGSSLLMKTLNNYSQSLENKASIKVAVVGFPGVGKRSIIKSLNKNPAGSEETSPLVQEKGIEKRVKILDGPGVVLSSDSSPVVLALRNMVRVESLKDVISPAESIVERANHTQLCIHFTVPDFGSCDELLSLLAKRMGKFKKGGVPNVEEGARRLINDWNRGVIKYYTRPPQVQEIEMSSDQTGFDFQINKQEEESEFQKVQQMFVSKGVESIASCPTDCFSLNQEEKMDVGMQEDMAEVKEVVLKKKTKKCKRMKHKK